MKKIACICLISCCIAYTAQADHITGGEIFYTLKSISGNDYTYSVTIKMYMDCRSYRDFYNPTYVSIFDKLTRERVRDILVNLSNIETISLTEHDDCIANPPPVCHRIGYYNFDLTLPASYGGYILATNVFFRVNNMLNLTRGYDNVGATYTAEIPGVSPVADGPKNNGARFGGNDLVIVCANSSFSYDFGATDSDGDQIIYALVDAYQASGYIFGNDINPPDPPPYASVPYAPEYSSGKPLGPDVKIDFYTGLITGIAPSPGTYVIAVCAQELRNGKLIAVQRKDLQINVAACAITAATLADGYQLCGDTKTIHLENLSLSSEIDTYSWLITGSDGEPVYRSVTPAVDYTFTDTGLYNINLVIDANGKCADSAKSTIRVYPGFVPGFDFKGICANRLTQFSDVSTSVYGNVNSWKWFFTGDIVAGVPVTAQYPGYTYTSTGNKNVGLIVGDDKGCIDTVFKTIDIVDKPPIQLAFSDTLICKPDTVSLIATGTGIFTWSPAEDILNGSQEQPDVAPQETTTYYVDLDIDGCTNRDSVVVQVVDHVSLTTMNDTTICSGDAVKLGITSDGLQYNWSPATQLDNAALQQPTAITTGDTKYTVVAHIGKCSAAGDINVHTVPYPVSFAGNDTTICFGTTAMLNGNSDGSSFFWTPQDYVLASTSLHTGVNPVRTTIYTLTSFDTGGCPKPGTDSVKITVLPEIAAFAGRDTTVVINQPLQLGGSGGTGYRWVPPTYLSDAGIANPIATFTQPSDRNRYMLLVSNEAGCIDSAFLTVKVYKTLPSVFVPSGFTPNADGRNDLLKPILAGMQRIEMFNIYNRWGQLVFSSKTAGNGWDGRINGVMQPAGTFVWMVKAIDYTGTPFFSKGTVTLVR